MPFDLIDLKPQDTPDYMIPAWASCIHWASTERGILDAFLKDTGMSIVPATDPLSRMIDDATGKNDAIVKAFVLWVNDNVWGPIDGPDSVAPVA